MFKINNLTYRYEKEKLALSNINMDFSKGNVVGIIGTNGSGKSTLFMNMVGILKPSLGSIIFNNEPIKYNKRSLYELRKEVGIVFQDPEKQIFYSMVYDDIAFALRNIGIEENAIKKRVFNALEAVNGLEFVNRPVHFLSYGQKKRVAIASVIAMENKMILLDEPTAGLDPISTKAIIEIINNLKDKGIRIAISSHNMNLIYEICDYIYVLDQGKIINEGSTDVVFNDEEKILKSGLELPWLVKIHKNLGLPLFKIEEDLYDFWNNSKNIVNP